jgi:hypothetical protein
MNKGVSRQSVDIEASEKQVDVLQLLFRAQPCAINPNQAKGQA